MPVTAPKMPLPDEALKGRRLGRKPTKAEIEGACEQLRRLAPDDQKVAVWLIAKLAKAEATDP